MKNRNNLLGIDIDYAIREYKKFKNNEYLQYLLSNLKNETIFVTIDNNYDPIILEDGEYSIPIVKKDNSPTIVISQNYEFWFSSFTTIKEIPNGFKEIYEIKEIRLKDLVLMCMENENIAGITINHKNPNGIRIRKDLLNYVVIH